MNIPILVIYYIIVYNIINSKESKKIESNFNEAITLLFSYIIYKSLT